MTSPFLSPTPFTIDAPSQLINLRQPPRSFTLHNARPYEAVTFFGGNRIVVPPVYVVGPDADEDADGEPIPGTRVVEDMFAFIPEIGDEIHVLDAVRAVRHILGIVPGGDGTAAIASSPFALGGLSLLPRHSTKAQWKAVAAAGEKRAFVAEVERARAHLRSVDEANAKRKAAERGPLPIGPEEERAAFLIQQYNEMVRQDLKTAMAPHQADELDEDLEMEAHVKAAALDLATKAAEGKSIDKTKLAEELLNDPAVRRKLQKTYHIKKRGHAPINAANLDAAAAAGQTVSGAGLEEPLAGESDPEPEQKE